MYLEALSVHQPSLRLVSSSKSREESKSQTLGPWQAGKWPKTSVAAVEVFQQAEAPVPFPRPPKILSAPHQVLKGRDVKWIDGDRVLEAHLGVVVLLPNLVQQAFLQASNARNTSRDYCWA